MTVLMVLIMALKFACVLACVTDAAGWGMRGASVGNGHVVRLVGGGKGRRVVERTQL